MIVHHEGIGVILTHFFPINFPAIGMHFSRETYLGSPSDQTLSIGHARIRCHFDECKTKSSFFQVANRVSR